jgi:hypothetical protein
MSDHNILLRRLHAKQKEIATCGAERIIIRAGRRSGKTTLASQLSIKHFGRGHRILYGTPVLDQVDRYWFEVKRALHDPINAGVLYKNDSMHIIGPPSIRTKIDVSGNVVSGEEMRIRAKTMYNADNARGDFGNVIILDEFQLMAEEVWDRVCAPMLLDNEGSIAIFIYTPPSLGSRAKSRAQDPMHAAKRFKEYQARMQDGDSRYAAFHFTSHDNPHLSQLGLAEISQDMTQISYRQEILAEDLDDNPNALWTRADIEANRVLRAPVLDRIVIGVDPSGSKEGDAIGIVGAGSADDHMYVLEDASLHGSPDQWARAVCTLYHKLEANEVVAEANFGGDMVASTIHMVDPDVPVKLVHASRGKQVRAEPIAAIYEQGRGHHVGAFGSLEDELCLWEPGMASPNRLDSLVWTGIELMLGKRKKKVSPWRSA